MDIIQQPGGCLQLRHNQDELGKPYLLISDVHFDSPYCDRKLLKRHLDEAVAKGAGIMCFGDWFDAMQSRNDRRSNKSDLREENKVAAYLDSLVYSSAEFLEPYKNNLMLMTLGNHESSVIQKLETDLLQRLIDELDIPTCYKGEYQGFIRFQHLITATSKRTNVLFWHHGGFHGVLTKGSLATARYASIVPDADIVVSGDTHDKWTMEHPRYKLTQNGTTKVVPQLHIKTACYKEEYGKNSGWAIEKIIYPKSLGGVWLSFVQDGEEIVAKATMT